MTSETTDAAASNWWVPFYDELLAETLLVRESESEVAATLDFLQRVLRLEPSQGQRVLDQCCGIGSLSNPLAARGFTVVGVDQASDYVERARRNGVHGTEFYAADAVNFIARPPCHAGFNWWTSYGYAPTREVNQAMLKGAFQSLIPGARFALDTMNLAGVLRKFEESVTVVRNTPMGEITMTRASRVDLEQGRLLKRWTYETEGREISTHNTSLMLSMPHDLAADLESAGFEVEAFYSGTSGHALSIDDPRCIVVARKPSGDQS